MGCVGIAKDIYLMDSEEDIYVNGRNFTFKKELQSSLALNKKVKQFEKNMLKIIDYVAIIYLKITKSQSFPIITDN